MREYFRDIYKTVVTILIGMRITLRYHFAKVVTVQYPDVAPVLQPRYRGFHYFEIEKCIACDLCAKACPVDCIYIEKTGPRKIDKATGVARGGAMERYAIDYAKCMFCALCIEPCPTDCIHMGDIHDLSGYDRNSMIVEFTELAKEGLQTPQPLWMQRDNLPAWAEQRKRQWLDRGAPLREEMVKALEESEIVKPKKPAKKPTPAAAAAKSGKASREAGPAAAKKDAQAERPVKPAGTAKPAKKNAPAPTKPADEE